MDLTLYIKPDAFILVPVLYFLGLFLRQTPQIPAWSYAWINLAFAVIACLLYFGFMIQSVVQGILVTGVAYISREILNHSLGLGSNPKDNQDTKKKDEQE